MASWPAAEQWSVEAAGKAMAGPTEGGADEAVEKDRGARGDAHEVDLVVGGVGPGVEERDGAAGGQRSTTVPCATAPFVAARQAVLPW